MYTQNYITSPLIKENIQSEMSSGSHVKVLWHMHIDRHTHTHTEGEEETVGDHGCIY